MKRLVIVDGMNLLSRAYHATAAGKEESQLAKNSKGVPINALKPALQRIKKLMLGGEFTHFIMTWDCESKDCIRRQIYEGYKGTRKEKPESFKKQVALCKELLAGAGVPQLSYNTYEADDIMGTLAVKWSQTEQGMCYLYSNDKDLHQLLRPNVVQIIANGGTEKYFSQKDFEEKFGLSPLQWADVKSLNGDKSDDIPGCPGVGGDTALSLIKDYNSLEKLYEGIGEIDSKYNRFKKKLLLGEEHAFLSKELATIIVDIPQMKNVSFESMEIRNLEKLKEEALLLGIQL